MSLSLPHETNQDLCAVDLLVQFLLDMESTPIRPDQEAMCNRPTMLRRISDTYSEDGAWENEVLQSHTSTDATSTKCTHPETDALGKSVKQSPRGISYRHPPITGIVASGSMGCAHSLASSPTTGNQPLAEPQRVRAASQNSFTPVVYRFPGYPRGSDSHPIGGPKPQQVPWTWRLLSSEKASGSMSARSYL